MVAYKKACTKKNIPSEENFNGFVKVLITHILYRKTTTEAYLEPSLFAKKRSQMLDWVLNIPQSPEKLLQECEYMANSPSLIKGAASTMLSIKK